MDMFYLSRLSAYFRRILTDIVGNLRVSNESSVKRKFDLISVKLRLCERELLFSYYVMVNSFGHMM